MQLSRILSLGVAAFYVIAFVCHFAGGPQRVGESREEFFENVFHGAGGLIFLLAVSLGCIWWGDELGEGMIGARYGLVSSPSPGWTVKLIGWIFLLTPAFLIIYIRARSR